MKLWVVQPYAGACSDNVGTGSEKRQLAQGGMGIKLIAWHLTRLHCSRQLVASEVEG